MAGSNVFASKLTRRAGNRLEKVLAGCVTTTTVLHATARGIAIRSLRTELEGEIDLQGFLALDARVSPGYEGIRSRMHIEADCNDEELDDLLNVACNHSPVCTTASPGSRVPG